MTRLIEIAGGQNVFADRDQESAKVEIAEVLVACWCGARTLPTAARVAARPGWEQATAVQTGQVDVVPEPYFGRLGPRLADGLEMLAKILHLELIGAGPV